MEKFFNSDSAYEKWVRKNKKKKNSQHNESEKKRYLKGLKGRVQNNLSGFLRVLVTAWIVFLQVLLIIFLPFLLRQFTVFFYFIVEIISVIAIATRVRHTGLRGYPLYFFCR